jgi:hypothetical protein
MKKNILLALLLSFSITGSFAQEKLKDVQAGSVWAPASAKVDGSLNEWNDTFQAFNKSTKVYYTLSNDDKFLYLTIKSTDATNNAKITAGGITVIINTAGKKKEDNAFTVTYPVINRPSRAQRGQRGGGFAGGFGGGRNAPTDSAAIEAAHKQFIAASKEIRVTGFKDITDTLISIYNEYSIKAAIGYNTQGNFNYELALPLKQLDLTPAATKEMAYNIKLNGLQVPERNVDLSAGGGGFGGGRGGGRGAGGGGITAVRGAGGGNGGGGGNRGGINFEELTSPTDFWGKYILAKK